jgi:hypothetical protein
LQKAWDLQSSGKPREGGPATPWSGDGGTNAGHCRMPKRAYIDTISLTEIKSAVCDLSPEELAELTAFISEQDNAVWREQMEQDAASGKLDFLFQEAANERHAGKLRDWPEKE